MLKVKTKAVRSGRKVKKKLSVHKFRLYVAPRTSPQYFDVVIHPTYEALQKARSIKDGGCEACFRLITLIKYRTLKSFTPPRPDPTVRKALESVTDFSLGKDWTRNWKPKLTRRHE